MIPEYDCSRGFATSIKQGCEESPRWLPGALIEYEVNEVNDCLSGNIIKMTDSIYHVVS